MALCPMCERRELARVDDHEWWCFVCGFKETVPNRAPGLVAVEGHDAAQLRPGSSVTEGSSFAARAAGADRSSRPSSPARERAQP